MRNVTSHCPGACRPGSTKAPSPRTLSGFCPRMAWELHWGAPGPTSSIPSAFQPLPLLTRNLINRTQNSVQLTELPSHKGLVGSEPQGLSTWGSLGRQGLVGHLWPALPHQGNNSFVLEQEAPGWAMLPAGCRMPNNSCFSGISDKSLQGGAHKQCSTSMIRTWLFSWGLQERWRNLMLATENPFIPQATWEACLPGSQAARGRKQHHSCLSEESWLLPASSNLKILIYGTQQIYTAPATIPTHFPVARKPKFHSVPNNPTSLVAFISERKFQKSCLAWQKLASLMKIPRKVTHLVKRAFRSPWEKEFMPA